MARLAVTFTVICFLFAFSHARTPLDLPEHDIVSRDPTITLPESETKTTILLPSEKPDTEPNTVFEIETQDREWKTASTEPIRESRESETESADESGLNQPFTVVTFRPSNRHFPHIRGDRQSPFFRRTYPCKHHHHRHRFGGEGPQFNGEGPRFNGGRREVSYGNDMILSGEEDTNADPMFRGDGERKIPARWVRFHHYGRPLFPFKHERFDMDDMKRPFHDHHDDDDDHHHDDDDDDHHHHHHDDDHHHHDDEDHHHHHHHDDHHHHHHHMEDDEESERNHEEGGGLMKLVRKFLNHY